MVAAVLSGNRNFEGRIHPQVKASYLASPPLVVAYALAGSLRKDLLSEPLGQDKRRQGRLSARHLAEPRGGRRSGPGRGLGRMFRDAYADVFKGDELWAKIGGAGGQTYEWEDASTYVRLPPYFVGMAREPGRPRDVAGRAHPGAARRFASPPTTSRPRARSPRTARPAAT